MKSSIKVLLVVLGILVVLGVVAAKFGYIAPFATKENSTDIAQRIQGQWYWESEEKVPVYYERGSDNPKEPLVPALAYVLNVNTSGATHEFLVEGGGKVDDGDDKFVMNGTSGTVEFSSSFSKEEGDKTKKGVAQIVYDPASDTITWTLQQEPEIETTGSNWFPESMVLRRMVSTDGESATR